MIDCEPDNVVTKSISVEVDVVGAFRLWTEQISAWWPVSHSISGDPETQVYVEGRVDGRFYERTPNGIEYDWGSVDVWDPPSRLVFTWYLGSSQELPTRVEVLFVSLGPTRTRIELEHRGPDLIGDLWWQRKRVFSTSWETVLDKYTAFLTSSKGDGQQSTQNDLIP